MMCAELWGAESGWLNFGEWTRREGGIAEVALLLENGADGGICNRVMEYEEECVLHWLVDGGREGSNCCKGRLLLDVGPPLSCHLFIQNS